MKFQNPNPSLKFFFEQTDKLTNEQTNKRMDKPKAICSPLFQRWGHKKVNKQCLFDTPRTVRSIKKKISEYKGHK